MVDCDGICVQKYQNYRHELHTVSTFVRITHLPGRKFVTIHVMLSISTCRTQSQDDEGIETGFDFGGTAGNMGHRGGWSTKESPIEVQIRRNRLQNDNVRGREGSQT